MLIVYKVGLNKFICFLIYIGKYLLYDYLSHVIGFNESILNFLDLEFHNSSSGQIY
jgi:hypothetical protein